MKKYKKGISTLGIIIGLFILNVIISMTTGFNVLSNTISFVTNKMESNNKEVESIDLTSDDYNDNTSGSYDIRKSAEWTGTDTAQINFNINTRLKTHKSYKDIIFVLDVSDSMAGEKLDKVKKDAKNLTESLLADSENRVALITFDTFSNIEYGLTNNKDALLAKIDSLTHNYMTNYNQALIKVDQVLEGYKAQDDRELIVLFLTDGYPNVETPNQVGQYQILKDKYPYITINGIQYEMGLNIIEDIKNISDNQYIASMENLSNILLEASSSPEPYEEFKLVDYIHDDYFYVESVDDIKVSIGKVELVEENGIQKVVWTAESDEFKTGNSANMTINLKLKKQYIGNEGYYPTNKKFEVTTKLPGEKEVKKQTDKTPILKSGYKVIYETNTPTGCELPDVEETHYAFENVKIADKKLNCDDYTFKGWEVIDGINKINGDYFIMPTKDITFIATWTKHDITKSMDGTVYEVPPIMRSYGLSSNDYHSMTYREKITKIVFSDNKNVPLTAIERWDVSEEENGSVIAYVEDDGTGNGTYKVTIGGNGGVIANEDSSYLFYGFTKLEEIDFKYFDTSNAKNMSHMFYGCDKLKKMDVSNFDTSNVTDMAWMFYRCGELTTLDLSNFNTSKVTNMSHMFGACMLTELDVSNFNTSNVTDMSYMFDGCNELAILDISGFNTSRVTDMSYMFDGCNELAILDISGFNTSRVTDMSYMFYGCNKLVTLDLGSFNTSNVTNMSMMFQNCYGLVTLDVSSFDTSKVTNMSFMFYHCHNLTELDISNFNTSKVTNMGAMFGFCSKLTSLDLSNFDTSKVTNMSSMFSDCKGLTATINIRTANAQYGSMFSFAATDNGSQIIVNYTSENEALVVEMIKTKYWDSHVVKGQLITD